MLRVEQGKGRKDRYTLLGPRLLAELRHYWQVYRPTPPWLFPQRAKPSPMDPATAQKMYYAAKRRAGITKAGGIHALAPCVYHAFAGSGHGSAHPATLAGPRECHDHHALRARGAQPCGRPGVTTRELTGRTPAAG